MKSQLLALPRKEKGPFGFERPKSREETPKEGCGRRGELPRAAKSKLRVHRTISKCIFCKAAYASSADRDG